MLSFTNHLTEATNTHLQHIEDLVFVKGMSGAREIFGYLSATRNMLAGHTVKSHNVSTKWDGAPALIVGTDPADGKFFVAKKGVFNKTPLVYKSHAQIDAAVSGSLADLFHTAFEELHRFTIPWTAIQGDFLFTHATLSNLAVDGEVYLSFQPNTIAYAVPLKSDLAFAMRRAVFGIVWHTSYSGKALASLSATYNAKITGRLPHTPRVWQTDAVFHDQAGFATMTAAETAAVTSHMATAGSILRQIPSEGLDAIGQNPTALATVLQFNNMLVRQGLTKWLLSPPNMAKELLTAAASKLTTPKGKEALGVLANFGVANLTAVYRFVAAITAAKLLLANQLDKVALTRTFINDASGYRATAGEGYVCVDLLNNQAVKLVDRMTFSRNNFSPDVIKGWS